MQKNIFFSVKTHPLIQVFFLTSKNTIMMLLAITCNILTAILEGLSFLLIAFGISFLVQEPQLLNSKLLFLVHGRTHIQVFMISVLCGVIAQIMRSISFYCGNLFMSYISAKMQAACQQKIYEQIFNFSFSCLSTYKTGDLIEYVRAPLAMGTILDALNRIIVMSLMLIALIILMFILSPSLTICILILFTIVGILQRMLIRKIATLAEVRTEHVVSATTHVVQSLHGLRAIFTFHRHKELLNKLGGILNNIAAASFNVNKFTYLLSPINEIIGVAFIGTVLMIGYGMMGSEYKNLMTLMLSFILLTYRLNGRITGILSGFSSLADHRTYVQRIQEILSAEGKEFEANVGEELINFNHAITFDKVSLIYATQSQPAIDSLSLSIAKGSTVAFVGESGAGKTSLIDLLVRLYDPAKGHIYVDGKNLTTLKISHWRQKLGVVSQDPIIFNDTIEENIRFGNEHITLAEIEEAARLSYAHHFIQNLPKGYQTVVGERGYRLSGGERQRIALARALVREPEVLILDEATSNLDSQSETLIQYSLEQLNQNMTLIIIAHRLSTVTMADQIYVLEKGRVIEQGSHEDLLDLQGRYFELWQLQSNASMLKERVKLLEAPLMTHT